MVQARIGTVYEAPSFELDPGEIFELPLEIRYVRILSATDTTNVSIAFANSSFWNLPPGLGLVIPNDFEAQRATIKNTSLSANVIRVAYGVAEIRDNTVIIDSENPVSILIPDGDDVAMGATDSAQAVSDSADANAIGLLKRICGKLPGGVRTSPRNGQSGIVTSTTPTAVLAAPAASSHLVVSSVTVISSGALDTVTLSGMAVPLTVVVDGTGVAGERSVTIPFPDGLPLTSATALTMTCATGTAVNVIANGHVEAD